MMWWLVGIGAAIGGLSGLFGGLSDTKRAKEDAQAQKDHIDELYNLQKEQAEEDWNNAQETANKNADRMNDKADLTDLAQNITETAVSNDFNTAIDNLYLSQASDTWSWNQAAMQMKGNEGAAYSNLAASGVRSGSSLSDAVLMDSSTNAAQLQFSQDSKRQSDNNNLESVLNSLAGNKIGITENRIGADWTRSDATDLVNSFAEGGYNWNVYQNQLKQMDSNYKYNMDQLDTEIKRNSGWNRFFKVAGSTLALGVKGAQTGYNLYNMGTNASKYNTGSEA
ncbi:MAG: hypothetical protein J6S67_21150 [Methanobrevibacter sp.]|nr:hypothetical protein [Methanobrevibacter sp.]